MPELQASTVAAAIAAMGKRAKASSAKPHLQQSPGRRRSALLKVMKGKVLRARCVGVIRGPFLCQLLAFAHIYIGFCVRRWICHLSHSETHSETQGAQVHVNFVRALRPEDLDTFVVCSVVSGLVACLPMSCTGAATFFRTRRLYRACHRRCRRACGVLTRFAVAKFFRKRGGEGR